MQSTSVFFPFRLLHLHFNGSLGDALGDPGTQWNHLWERNPVLIALAGPDPQGRCLEILHVCFVPH